MICRLFGAKPLSKQCWCIFNWNIRNRLQINFITIQTFLFTKLHLKISFAKWRPISPGGNALIKCICTCTYTCIHTCAYIYVALTVIHNEFRHRAHFYIVIFLSIGTKHVHLCISVMIEVSCYIVWFQLCRLRLWKRIAGALPPILSGLWKSINFRCFGGCYYRCEFGEPNDF